MQRQWLRKKPLWYRALYVWHWGVMFSILLAGLIFLFFWLGPPM